ncbi:MAG: glutamate-5-semialdehyde dehydrogenase [Clostridia bacterium]|nr:glutamate-5-semialdehyde dehydrogenase [Clostridia bacterium]
MGKNAKQASRKLSVAGTDLKNKALLAIADALRKNAADVIKANAIDIENARKMGISETMIDRLRLDEKRIDAIADAVLDVIKLQDPVGEVLDDYIRPNGLNIKKVAVPMGVIGIIYESRPNVTVDAACLCLKSGNVTILRGGKEAFNSNTALSEIMRDAISSVGLPADCVQLVGDTSRESANQLMRLSGYLDVLIPRGGAGLIKAVVENSTVPVIETGTGNCHVYVDEYADIKMAADIVYNAKTSRPSVCNACESLLLHKNVAEKALPLIKERLDEKGVEIRGCERTKAILGDSVVMATDEDYATEFLDYIISVKIVDSLDEAVDHIMKYTSGHSECIVTENAENAQRFTANVDAAAVYVNASTRFTDGGEFGFGAEIGISTQKLHARGPMGLKQLTSVKYVVLGNGQIR